MPSARANSRPARTAEDSPMASTSKVTVTFNLDSSASQPPYNVSPAMTCQVEYSDGSTPGQYPNFTAEVIGTPQNGGAQFVLNVVDSSYSSTNTTNVGNWALTCIPRGSSPTSPFQGQGSPTITDPSGNQPSSTNSNGTFTLATGNATIANAGTWDWSLMVQMIMADGTTIKCFASDPEMDVS